MNLKFTQSALFARREILVAFERKTAMFLLVINILEREAAPRIKNRASKGAVFNFSHKLAN